MKHIPDGFDVLDAPIEGFYSAGEQFWTISPQPEWEYFPEREWLCLGSPGVDGIEFGVRKNIPGVFAYYPTDEHYVVKAASVPELIQGWCNGTIKV